MGLLLSRASVDAGLQTTQIILSLHRDSFQLRCVHLQVPLNRS